METIEIMALVVLVLETAATCIFAAAIWSGIFALARSDAEFKRRHDELSRKHEKEMAQQREAEDRRREEATAAPEDSIRRTTASDSGTGE